MVYKMHVHCPTSSFLPARGRKPLDKATFQWLAYIYTYIYICHRFISCKYWPCHRNGACAHTMSTILFPPVGKCDTSQVNHQCFLVLISRTVAKNVNVYQINLMWKLCGDYSCEYLYIPQSLAYLSNNQVVGIWLILCSPNWDKPFYFYFYKPE
jgi:hypothetical protein